MILSGYDGTSSIAGWMDEPRVSKGVARWTSHFTPYSWEYGLGVPTVTPTPVIDDSYTQALLHANGTDASRAFMDQQDLVFRDAQIDTEQSMFGGSSGSSMGRAILYTLNNADWRVDGGSDANKWTIDTWVKFTDPGTALQGWVNMPMEITSG
jgi:hypothetical protein